MSAILSEMKFKLRKQNTFTSHDVSRMVEQMNRDEAELARLRAIEAAARGLADNWIAEGERRHNPDLQGPAYTLCSAIAGCGAALAVALQGQPVK